MRFKILTLSEAERKLQAGESDTDLLCSGIPQEIRSHKIEGPVVYWNVDEQR